MTQQNQVYFDITEFTNDVIRIKAERNALNKEIAMEANCTLSVISNFFNLGRCSVDTLAGLCAWGNLDPRKYFVVNPYHKCSR